LTDAAVIDASIALAWCFPDEASAYADAVLAKVEGRVILVPAVWPLEITNALAVAVRRKRIGTAEVIRFTELLEGLAVEQDAISVSAGVNHVLPLAREYNLSAYDAAYLEVAIRHGAPLATLDGGLERAARKAGVERLP